MLLGRMLRRRGAVKYISFTRQYPGFLFPGKSDRDPSLSPLALDGVSYLIDSLNPFTWVRAALEMARQIVPELIISDINLAGHSGLELCERIKAVDELREVPLMFLSGAQVPDIIRRSRAAGGVYYLRKPFDPEVLLELVEKALWMPHVAATRITSRDQRAVT